MIHRAALKYAGKGKPVFPCKPNKRPYTPRGFKNATTDPGRVTALWTRYGGEKIGMPTGEASGVFVVDVDRLEAMEELAPELVRSLRETLTIRTPSGGFHYYLNHVPGITNKPGTLPAGIDIRGEGGYAIVPPSEGYAVEHRAPIADAPEQLLETLRDKPRGKPSAAGRTSGGAESIPDDGGPIPDGTRDETLTRIAGLLHDGTRDAAQLEDDLQAVNEARCIPPLPPEQVRKIARSVSRYEPCRRARREPDAATIEALAAIERTLLRGEYKGQSGKTDYSIYVAALKLARKYGTLVDDGVRVEVSTRQLALAAAVSRRTIATKLKNLGGILRPDNENVAPGKAGAIVLLTPRATLHHSTQLDSYIDKQGGCAKWRAPLTAPRLRWSSPAYKPKKGVTPGTCRVRDTITTGKRDAVIRLGKSCERAMDRIEIASIINGRPTMEIPALAAALDVKRPRDLTRRKNPETGKGRDGIVTRLEAIGVLLVVGDTVILADNWLEALDRERESAGEIALYQRDMRKYNRESKAYRDREKVEAEPAPSQEEMRETRESYPERRREAIKDALARLFQERPEYRGRRAGQITCRLPFFFDPDFPRGRDGMPKDAEVEAILEGVAA
jgi:putative DNA primase/helicase